MPFDLNDRQLNFGKVLVLAHRASYTNQEIASRIRATKVVELRRTYNKTTASGLLIDAVERGLFFKKKPAPFTFYKLYRAYGDAKSSFAAISTPEFICALTIRPNDLKKLHNKVRCMDKLEDACCSISSAIYSLGVISDGLTDTGKDATGVQIKSYALEKTLSSIQTDQEWLMQGINKIINNTW